MADFETILQYIKSIDDRTVRIESVITTAMQIHQQADDTKHDIIDKRIKSLENSRTAARATLIGAATAGTGGAAKLGMLAKITSLFS